MIRVMSNPDASTTSALDISYSTEYFNTINACPRTAYYTYTIRKMFILNMLINRPLCGYFGGGVAVLANTGDTIRCRVSKFIVVAAIGPALDSDRHAFVFKVPYVYHSTHPHSGHTSRSGDHPSSSPLVSASDARAAARRASLARMAWAR